MQTVNATNSLYYWLQSSSSSHHLRHPSGDRLRRLSMFETGTRLRSASGASHSMMSAKLFTWNLKRHSVSLSDRAWFSHHQPCGTAQQPKAQLSLSKMTMTAIRTETTSALGGSVWKKPIATHRSTRSGYGTSIIQTMSLCLEEELWKDSCQWFKVFTLPSGLYTRNN